MPQSQSWQNTNDHYGTLSKALHWVTAIGIIAMIPLGKIATDVAYDTAEALAQKAWPFQIHKTLGVALFFLALIRIGWMLSQHKPAPLHPERRLETFLAELMHWLLYGAPRWCRCRAGPITRPLPGLRRSSGLLGRGCRLCR